MLPKTVKTYKNITLTITESTNKIKIKYMSHYAECTTYNNYLDKSYPDLRSHIKSKLLTSNDF